MRVKFLSWNIWQGKFLEEVISFLKTQNADIIALQEVTVCDGKNLAEEIAKKLNYQYVYGKAFSTDRHSPKYDLGEAILTRLKILDSENHLLSEMDSYKGTPETEPRVLVKMLTKIGEKTVWVLNTHLAYSGEFQTFPLRLSQTKKLINLIPKNNTILAGDFNALPGSQEIALIKKKMINVDVNTANPTWTLYPFDHHGFKTSELKYRLDNIFVTADIKYSNFQIEKSRASDHLPISVEINI